MSQRVQLSALLTDGISAEVRRLRAFLHDVDAAPFMFKRMVHCKRLHDFGDSYVLDDEVAQTHSGP